MGAVQLCAPERKRDREYKEVHVGVIEDGEEKLEPDQLLGEASKTVWFLDDRIFPKCNSVEITNDPRIVQNSVINKRFAAYQAISVAATLMASLALTTAVGVETMENELTTDVALGMMLIVFLMNIWAVLVITQQYYQILRLETSQSHGFEIAHSYYFNGHVRRLRHYATQSFFLALPIYVLAVALTGFAKLKTERPQSAVAILGCLCFAALILAFIIHTQHKIFKEHDRSLTKFAHPLMLHMEHVNRAHNDNDVLLG